MAKRTMSARMSAFASSARSHRTLARSKPNRSSSQSSSRPLPGMDLPAVPARGAARDALGLDQHDVGAGLGQMDGRRKAGEAAADDADVGPARAVERGVFGHVAEGEPIEGRRKRAGHFREMRSDAQQQIFALPRADHAHEGLVFRLLDGAVGAHEASRRRSPPAPACFPAAAPHRGWSAAGRSSGRGWRPRIGASGSSLLTRPR